MLAMSTMKGVGMTKNRLDVAHAGRRGWLKNGNPPGDLSLVKQCGAKTRRGTSCQQPAMKNGRCRLHGGKSTGPRTKEGLARARKGNWKHGGYSEAAKTERREIAKLLLDSRILAEKISTLR